ncbi:MAG: methionyl-tRNA formyltransferase [Acidobacteriota bacterium]
MRVVFFGTPEWAVPSLEALVAAGHEIAAVVTAPDRPRGRSRTPAPTPVRQAADRLGVAPVLRPATLRDAAARAAILEPEPDALVVVAYGRILPGRLLDAPRHGAINVHFSLLPRHRGASPVQWAILCGDRITGVSTMLMDRGLDTGPVLLQRETPIGPRETAPQLGERLARIGAELLVETLEGLARGALEPRPQDASRASLAPMLKPEMGHVDWRRTAAEIDRQVRAFAAWPPVVCRASAGRLRLLEVLPAGEGADSPPGTVVGVDREAVHVACGENTLLALLAVQPAGRRAMRAVDAVRGRLIRPGERLGRPDDDAAPS